MARKLIWENAKKPKPRESMFEEEKVFRNGQVVHHKLDSLAKRARFVEREWAKRNKFDIK